MRQGTEYEGHLGRYLEPIRALPFVTALDCVTDSQYQSFGNECPQSALT